MTATWVFPDPPNTIAQTLRSILQGQPVLFVHHDENGTWHFFDGRQVWTGEELDLAPLQRIIELHPSLAEFHDLPKGWRARRWDEHGPWERESVKTQDKTRAHTAELLAKMQRARVQLPPGSPSTIDLLREDRQR